MIWNILGAGAVHWAAEPGRESGAPVDSCGPDDSAVDPSGSVSGVPQPVDLAAAQHPQAQVQHSTEPY